MGYTSDNAITNLNKYGGGKNGNSDDKKKKKPVEKSKDKRFTGKAGDKSSVKTRGGGERTVVVGGRGVKGKF